MAKITINIPITVEAELDKFGRVRISSATWPNLSFIEQELLKLSQIKQVLIKAKLRAERLTSKE